MVLYLVLDQSNKITHSRVERLTTQLKSLSILNYPGENVISFNHDASKLVRDIMMCFMNPDQVPQLTVHSLTGLSNSTDSFFKGEVMRALIKYDNNRFEGTLALPVSKDARRTALWPNLFRCTML